MRVVPLDEATAPAWQALFEASGSPCFCRYWHFEGKKNDWLARCALRPDENRDAQLALAFLCPPIVSGTPVIFRLPPDGTQPSCLFHSVKSRKERTGSDLERAVSDLLDTPGDAQSMEFAVANRLEDEQVQRSLQKICLISFQSQLSY